MSGNGISVQLMSSACLLEKYVLPARNAPDDDLELDNAWILPLFRHAHLTVAQGFANASLTVAEKHSRSLAMHSSAAELALCVEVGESRKKV